MRTTGDRIREARKAKSLPRTALAALVGVSAATVKRWELGTSSPSALELHAIGRAAQCSPCELLGTREENEHELRLRAQAEADARLELQNAS